MNHDRLAMPRRWTLAELQAAIARRGSYLFRGSEIASPPTRPKRYACISALSR